MFKKLRKAQEDALHNKTLADELSIAVDDLKKEVRERDWQIECLEAEIKRLHTGIEEAREMMRNIR